MHGDVGDEEAMQKVLFEMKSEVKNGNIWMEIKVFHSHPPFSCRDLNRMLFLIIFS